MQLPCLLDFSVLAKPAYLPVLARARTQGYTGLAISVQAQNKNFSLAHNSFVLTVSYIAL
jgi:hypothetical protein